MYDTSLWLGGKEFKSRLIVGTGKYPSFENMREAIEASGAQIVTVAVRRVNLPGQGESLLDFIDTKKYTLLPNTAGCYTADEAVRTCYLAREAGLGTLVKVEVIGDSRTLFPDVEGLLEATRTLAREGFSVLPYTNDDPVLAKKLEDAGAAAVMPLGAPSGMTAAAPASSSFLAMTGSSLVYGSTVKPSRESVRVASRRPRVSGKSVRESPMTSSLTKVPRPASRAR